MEQPQRPNENQKSDELDLAQLFKAIGSGFRSIFKAFLRVFVYLKRRAIIIGILGIVGLAAGIGLNQIITKKLKTDVIVKPNLDSKSYLYDVVAEIEANIKAGDTTFFKDLGIDIEEVEGFLITVEPVATPQESNKKEDEDLKYLELLEKFQNYALVGDVVRNEILNKSALNHRITFFYKESRSGSENARKLMNYINSNDYFEELVKIHQENARERINYDVGLVKQIDDLVAKYSEKIGQTPDRDGSGRIVLENEEGFDITGLLGLKNSLIRDIERKKLELQEQKEAVRIINFGKTQEVQVPFLGRSFVLLPLVLISFVLLFDLIRYFNRKAKEMQLE